jgi:L-ribulokinase
VLKLDEEVRTHAYTWLEHCDWISAELTGNINPSQIKRSRCAAGHKALWAEEFGGLPPNSYFKTIDPLLDGVCDRMPSSTYTSNIPMGKLSFAWAEKLGLSTNVVVGVGAFDCHMGAVGAQISQYEFVRVMGTSTCDIMVSSKEDLGDTLVRGICGQVDGSVLPNMIGLEAGQSAFGDYYAWYQSLIIDSLRGLLPESEVEELSEKMIFHLAEQASKIVLSPNDAVASDWINGRRTPDANHSLKAALTGLSLGTDTFALFKCIVEATAFGSRAIIERFKEEGIRIDSVIAIGGVAKKSPYVMQTLTDVLDLPIKVASSDQACALGAAMFASVVGGAHASIQEAQHAMGSGYDTVYYPRPENKLIYDELYIKYLKLSNI